SCCSALSRSSSSARVTRACRPGSGSSDISTPSHTRIQNQIRKGSSNLKSLKSILATAALAVALAAFNQGTAAAQTDNPDIKQDRSGAMKNFLEAQDYERAGNFSKAVASYKEAITLDPSSAELRISLGSLSLKNRDDLSAEEQAREAIKIAPEN